MSSLVGLPRALVLDVRTETNGVSVLCQIDKMTFKNEKWIDDKYLGYLKHGERLISGRWRNSGGEWSFLLKDGEDGRLIEKDQVFECLDGYYGERAELVLKNLSWEARTLSAEKDHGHCDICWETIDAHKSHMRSNENDSICIGCFELYVKPKNLAFIQEWAK